MAEGSKVGAFWIGFLIALVIALIGLPQLFIVASMILGGAVILILSIVVILIVSFFVIKAYPQSRYFLLGVFTAICTGIIFFGTCFAGGMIGSKIETGNLAGLGGIMLSIPFAFGFAIWFLIFVARRVSKVSGK